MELVVATIGVIMSDDRHCRSSDTPVTVRSQARHGHGEVCTPERGGARRTSKHESLEANSTPPKVSGVGPSVSSGPPPGFLKVKPRRNRVSHKFT